MFYWSVMNEDMIGYNYGILQHFIVILCSSFNRNISLDDTQFMRFL